MTDERARWNELEIRRPNDVPCPTPLSWQIEKHSEHADRLLNNLLPADFPYEVERGTADDAVAVLALRESIRRDIELGTGNRIHQALTLGATWTQVAAALAIEAGQARELLRAYADSQRNLWLGYEEKGVKPVGLDADAYAAILALVELGDEETTKPEPLMAACTPNSLPDADGEVEHGFQINVLNEGMDILATIDLPDWESFRPASAGHRLIEHGYMIHPEARGPETVNGWRQAGAGWMVSVIRTECTDDCDGADMCTGTTHRRRA
jgi:hypothetical protein